MALQSMADVPLLITSPNSSSERRISPSWTIAQLKGRLEPITGVPASCQQLSLRLGSQDAVAIAAADEEQTCLAAFPLQPYAEMTVSASSTLSLHSLVCPVLDRFDILPSRQLPHFLFPPPPPAQPPINSLAPTLASCLAPSCTLPLPSLFARCFPIRSFASLFVACARG